MDEICVFPAALVAASPCAESARNGARLRIPGTDRSLRVRTLALAVSALLHALGLGILAWARLTAPTPAPPPLVEVEFVEIAGARGGGGSSGLTPSQAPAPSRGKAAMAVRPVEPAIPLANKQASAPSTATQPAAAGLAGAVAAGQTGGGTGGGAGGGNGSGAGQSSGGGTGQGGAAVDRMPVPVQRVKPVYPMAARRRGIGGQVRLKLYVDAEGTVREVQVQSAEPAGMFEDKAVEAVRKWRFKPAVSHGTAVGMWMTLPVRFALEDR